MRIKVIYIIRAFQKSIFLCFLLPVSIQGYLLVRLLMNENLILYTCYPFDALGFTPNRYFVYASYTSGPELDADR